MANGLNLSLLDMEEWDTLRDYEHLAGEHNTFGEVYDMLLKLGKKKALPIHMGGYTYSLGKLQGFETFNRQGWTSRHWNNDVIVMKNTKWGYKEKKATCCCSFGFFSEQGEFFTADCTVILLSQGNVKITERCFVTDWKKRDKYVRCYIINLCDTQRILEKTNPYGYRLWRENPSYKPEMLLIYPYLEQLAKAKYSFAHDVLYRGFADDKEIAYFNRLCKKGNSLKDIFKTDKVVYETLKTTRLENWDVYRRLYRKGTVSKDTFVQVYNAHYSNKVLEQINSVLSKTYEDKPVFTFDTLQNYLIRLDMYEAIGTEEALMLLSDYLNMCNMLGIRPKTDGDSLKREHDVIARTCRQKRNEKMAEKMNASCEYLIKYNYAEEEFFIRGIKDYDDLIDEASQQHNCVASYAQRIIDRQSLIFTMRYTSSPNRSLVTVELSPDGRTIRQKYLAYNRPIHDRKISEFLERWLDRIKVFAE